MSLNVVARLLTSFKSLQEFMGAIADAMTGKTTFVDSDRKTPRSSYYQVCLSSRSQKNEAMSGQHSLENAMLLELFLCSK
jgi:hypothetical protein